MLMGRATYSVGPTLSGKYVFYLATEVYTCHLNASNILIIPSSKISDYMSLTKLVIDSMSKILNSSLEYRYQFYCCLNLILIISYPIVNLIVGYMHFIFGVVVGGLLVLVLLLAFIAWPVNFGCFCSWMMWSFEVFLSAVVLCFDCHRYSFPHCKFLL